MCSCLHFSALLPVCDSMFQQLSCLNVSVESTCGDWGMNDTNPVSFLNYEI